MVALPNYGHKDAIRKLGLLNLVYFPIYQTAKLNSIIFQCFYTYLIIIHIMNINLLVVHIIPGPSDALVT